MKNKVIVITGANSGIGKATSIELAKLEATVVMACRNIERGKEALIEVREKSASKNIDLMLCDLGSLKSIRNFCEAFTQKYHRLDVLINNAGIILPKRRFTEDGFEMQLGVNHFGHFY